MEYSYDECRHSARCHSEINALGKHCAASDLCLLDCSPPPKSPGAFHGHVDQQSCKDSHRDRGRISKNVDKRVFGKCESGNRKSREDPQYLFG